MLTCFVLAILCGLSGNILLGVSGSVSKLKAPELNIKMKEYVIQANETLHLTCRGKTPPSWSLPESVNKDRERLNIIDYGCGSKGKLFCSNLTLSWAQAKDTGYYNCKYSTANGRKRKRTQTAVYIFVKDPTSPFVELPHDIPDIVYMTKGKKLVIPCRVSSPDITITLKKFPMGTLIPDGKNITWDSRQGFVIPKPTYQFIGLLTCEAKTRNGHLVSKTYLTHRQGNKIIDVQINVTNPVKLLKGKTLAINCTVTAGWNTRPEINWDYPNKANNVASITNKIRMSKSHAAIYSVFIIEKVHDIDRGEYTCHVQSGPSERRVNTTVLVYEKPFINVKLRNQPVVEVNAGRKSYRIPVKVKAFPSPEVVWLKDGMLAAEKCARYKISGYSLIIKDVAEEDAGTYTIMLGIQQWSLYKNFSVSLKVNVKPQILEKAVSFQDPTLYSRGSKQILKCTATGIPNPRIQWVWQLCTPSSSRTQCEMHSDGVKHPFRLKVGNSTGNIIQSITEKIELIDGKNKTVGILVVAESNASGIYHCEAFNKVGADQRNINFFVTDVPNGFQIDMERAPVEGDDLMLSCRANKFLYTDIAWHLLKTADNRTMSDVNQQGVALMQEYSISLNLNIKNVSQNYSGTYACTAKNTYTGEEVIRYKSIGIRAQEAPHLLRNLSDQNVNVSSSITLYCLAKGLPEPQVTWYKNRQKVQQGSGIMLGPGNSTLIIERIKEDDEGLYQCQATNQKGSAESSAYITVQGTSETSNLELITLTCTCVAATLFWLLLTLFIRKLKRPNSAEIKTDYLSIIMDPDEVPLDEQCECLSYDASKWEFPRDRLKLGKSLGRGAFGKVVQASAFGIKKSATCKTVAVKMLKEGATASEYKALMTELKILIHIGHHLNVVNLLGACTKQGGPLMVIVEYCKYGNLSNYLKSKRDLFLLHKDTVVQSDQMRERSKTSADLDETKKQRLDSFTSSESSVSSGFDEDKSLSDVEEEEEDADAFYKQPIMMEDLISYSFQVARGMEFLSSRKCIHRDLAARNILLSENNVVKICDFGLARDIYKDPDYVRKGDARLPLKWMAPESIFDKVYTTKSDVWSYGVLLWEIFSLGASPYPGVQIDEDFCCRLKEGTRMRTPDYASPEIYQTMLDCWQTDPKDRPTFSELVKQLGDLLQESVQQDGKDYIPLNTISTSNNFGCPSPTSPDSCLGEYTQAPPFNYGSFGYMNNYKNCPPQSIKIFEDISLKDVTVFDQDYQTDSGMVLASEELKHLMWIYKKQNHPQTLRFTPTNKAKESVLTEMVSRMSTYNPSNGHRGENSQAVTQDRKMLEPKISCCLPPPDYNSVVLYSSSTV
ncbi:vascular endothelial growth factor receptor 1 [Latimeria chalumnae]|uniref:vascular endothelial growth factor receptor 1 n=1 Tax=Latimeria chalumnae TaxID=7897 RepID=UPI0003C132AD